jgi:hypothetical protein|tara:strand:- start:546 stop:1265 length:720 start_codon:yes stop_codon:yes gene_type:complete
MILVTAGCSFSECISPWIDTWPKHLEKLLGPSKAFHTGLGSIGNGLISRRVIHQVHNLLKDHRADELLVGIQWSGPDRHEFFKEDIEKFDNTDGWMENPAGVVDAGNKNWIITNAQWSNSFSKSFYKMFHDDTGSYISTLEHILRTQWFLKSNGIKYFMSTYTSEVIPNKLKNNVHTKHLYEQIDRDNFLPVEGQYEWCRDHSGIPYNDPDNLHPSSKQHEAFARDVIIRFCKRKGILE